MNKHLWVYSGLFVSFFVLFLIFGKPQTLTSVPDVVPQSALSASDSELADSEPEEIPSLALQGVTQSQSYNGELLVEVNEPDASLETDSAQQFTSKNAERPSTKSELITPWIVNALALLVLLIPVIFRNRIPQQWLILCGFVSTFLYFRISSDVFIAFVVEHSLQGSVTIAFAAITSIAVTYYIFFEPIIVPFSTSRVRNNDPDREMRRWVEQDREQASRRRNDAVSNIPPLTVMNSVQDEVKPGNDRRPGTRKVMLD